MKKNLFIIAFVFILFSACKKGNDDTCPVTVESVSGSYKLTSLQYKATASSAEENWYQQVVEDCKKDDVYVLAANGDFTILDVGSVCQQSGFYQGIWSLETNYMDLDGYYAGSVESYNCNTLVLAQSDALVSGDKLTATFVKQ